MATYTPKNFIGPAASLTTTPIAYVSPAATFGVIRSILAASNEAARALTVSLGADAVGTRIVAAYPLTINIPYVLNGWWITATNSANAINMLADTVSANKVIGNISGYEYA